MPRSQAMVNGSVYLGRGRVIEKGFVVFRGPRIERIGSTRDFTRSPDTEVTDLNGKLVLPGLVDSHLHLVGYARSLIEPDLAPTHSLEEGLEMVRAFAAGLPKGAWLTGRGWDKQRWGLAEFPTRQMLDRVAEANPVSLTSRDGHLAWVNSVGLRELGFADRAAAVDGGEIVVDDAGRPTGIFKENAEALVRSRVGGREEERLIEAIVDGAARLRRFGLTAVHSLDDGINTATLTRALGRGAIGIRVVRIREVLEPDDVNALEPAPEACCLKTYADGTLGSQTASMLKPYSGQPANVGIASLTASKLREIVFRALGKGFGICVHAIGDRANREVLDVYEEARRQPAYRETLLRLEHAQVLDPDDIPRFARLGIVASMQPIHLVSDRHVAEKYWGERSATAYAWKRILDTGGTVIFGSDAPIESPDPLRGVHAAVTRSDPARPEEGPWYPDERLEVWRAVDCYAGSRIAVGAPAHFTILDRDILGSADPSAILEAQVVGTVVSGSPAFNG